MHFENVSVTVYLKVCELARCVKSEGWVKAVSEAIAEQGW
jgi:hypothetical protein